jgi:hypothetical protein
VAKLIALVQSVYEETADKHGNNSYHTEIGTRVAEMTMAYAQKVRADLICLGTRGCGKLEKLL